MKKFFGAVFAAGLFVSACGDSTADNDEDKSNAEQEESLVDEGADTNADKEDAANEMSLEEDEDESSEEDSDEREGSSDEDGQAVADAITEEFASAFEIGDDSIVEQKDADCVGEGYVKEIGVERLAELDVTAESASGAEMADFSDDEEEKIEDIMKDCVGVEKAFAAGMQQGGLEKDDAECIASKIDGGLLDRLIDAEDAEAELFTELSEEGEKAAEDCGVESSLF